MYDIHLSSEYILLTDLNCKAAGQLKDKWYKVPDLVSPQDAKLKEKEEEGRYLRVGKKEKYSFRARK